MLILKNILFKIYLLTALKIKKKLLISSKFKTQPLLKPTHTHTRARTHTNTHTSESLFLTFINFIPKTNLLPN